MRNLILLLWFLLTLAALSSRTAQAFQDQPTPASSDDSTPLAPGSRLQILAPNPGQALQGSVPIVVDTTITDFQDCELTFGYMDDPTQTWFWLHQSVSPVTGAMLFLWDTSTITDGDYQLRLMVKFKDGSQKFVVVTDLRVRNYTPLETNTPTPLPPSPTYALAATTTPTPPAAVVTRPLIQWTATPLPGNPISLGQEQVLDSIGKGALYAAGVFVLGILIWMARAPGNRR